MLDHEKEIVEYEETLARLRERAKMKGVLDSDEMELLEGKVTELKQKVYARLDPVERLAISRHPARPKTLDYIKSFVEDFTELHGDRAFRDDPAIVGGFGKVGGQKFMIIGQEKGSDTDSRLLRNFGSSHPEGFRKALRLMQMAAKFHMPIITFIDTAGAYPGLTAEERGQGWAIATNLREMAILPTPIINVMIGEAGSGGAIAIAVGDRVGMLEHAYYSVISPEGCASILWKDPSKKGEAAAALKMNAENMVEFGVVDEVIAEPMGGAHHDPQAVYSAVEAFINKSWDDLREIPMEQLLEQRYRRFRDLGEYQE